MKNLLLFVAFFTAWFQSNAQLEPAQSDMDELKAMKVKKVMTSRFSANDTSETEGISVLEKEFDDKGKITKKYALSVWESVSNDITIRYIYDNKHKLTETNAVRTVRNLNERDDDYIRSFGDRPLYEKVKYFYGDDGKLARKEVFVSGDGEAEDNAEPNQVIVYTYENGHLIKEESTCPNKRVFNQNYLIEYAYNPDGKVSSQTRHYGENNEKFRNTILTYDSLGNLVEEKITDSGIARNNVHYRYQYDEHGKLTEKLSYDREESEFVTEISYAYDQHGHLIYGENQTELSCYPNGLIRSETWKDEITGQVFYFVTTYDFY